MERNCETCKFFLPSVVRAIEHGECRVQSRKYPLLMLPTGWCGAWTDVCEEGTDKE